MCHVCVSEEMNRRAISIQQRQLCELKGLSPGVLDQCGGKMIDAVVLSYSTSLGGNSGLAPGEFLSIGFFSRWNWGPVPRPHEPARDTGPISLLLFDRLERTSTRGIVMFCCELLRSAIIFQCGSIQTLKMGVSWNPHGERQTGTWMKFDLHVGIDYSGRAVPGSRTAALQVYASRGSKVPKRIPSPASSPKRHRNWCRAEIVTWLLQQTRSGQRMIAGIDHGFSFPISYCRRYGLMSWPRFLDDFCKFWPTDRENVSVEDIRNAVPIRPGSADEYRLTELWTSSAKSVFHFDVQGSVAKSTHAGIPWLRWLREETGNRIHFWPFDGWQVPEDKSVLAEVYPSILRNRFPRVKRTVDQQDAYATARWLSEMDHADFLDGYLDPPITTPERSIADLEGWILGIV